MKEKTFGILLKKQGGEFVKICKFTSIMMLGLSIITYINIAFIYFLPYFIPISSFTSIRLTSLAFIDKRYYLIAISILLNSINFISAFEIQKKHVFFPILSIVYNIFDLGYVLYLFMYDIVKNQFIIWSYIPSIIIYSTVILLLVRTIKGRFFD